MKITVIPRKRDLHKKRVAAYCRVSTLLDNQEESFETQVSYYTALIASNEDWEFAGIYSDEKSGTKADNRPGFKRMIRDALDGRVDYILVKSVSRFSRNIVDCQKYVKLLHGNGVDVRFEKEHLDTADPSCSMMFSFLSTIAQDESRSISENVKWGYRERFKRGEYNIGNNRILGYDSVDGILVPNEDAGIIRIIYQMFIDGKEMTEIAKSLDALGFTGRNHRPLTRKGVLYILQNEVYVGDKILQKHPPKDFLTKQPDKNIPFQSYYLKDDHLPIIERSMWEKVQKKLDERKKETEAGTVRYHGGRAHFLYGRVFCADCGAPMTRRTLREYSRSDDKQTYKAWTCSERHKGRKGNGCRMRTIRETDLLSGICLKMGFESISDFPTDQFRMEVKRVNVSLEDITVICDKNTTISA